MKYIEINEVTNKYKNKHLENKVAKLNKASKIL